MLKKQENSNRRCKIFALKLSSFFQTVDKSDDKMKNFDIKNASFIAADTMRYAIYDMKSCQQWPFSRLSRITLHGLLRGKITIMLKIYRTKLPHTEKKYPKAAQHESCITKYNLKLKKKERYRISANSFRPWIVSAATIQIYEVKVKGHSK